jgi:superfamily II DNA or RNA helicase
MAWDGATCIVLCVPDIRQPRGGEAMPRSAQEQIELFPDLLTISTKPRGGSEASDATGDRAGSVQGSAREAGAVGPARDSRQEADPDLWLQRLVSAFEHLQPADGYLPLAEAALKACPGDPNLLLLAANAALIDGDHARALVFLKRFHKRASSTSEHLLRALALNLAGLRGAGRCLLERHRLTSPFAAISHFPAGRSHSDWLIRHLNQIMGRDQPLRPYVSDRRWATKGARPPQVRKTAATEQRGKNATVRSTAGKPARPAVEVPASEAVPAALTPLPLVDIDIPLAFQLDAAPLIAGLGRAPEIEGRYFQLRERLAHLSLVQGFDELMCLPHLVGVAPLWHQIEAVRKVLKQFRGRVLLADEVGLGKTIEAAMVLKEYALRGMAACALVLTPASLVGQWREELEAKFDLQFATTYDALLREDPHAFWNQPRIVASIATARRREHMETLARRQLDIVVVDEAHHLRDRSSAGWKLVDALNKRFLLLLSATPVQNDLIELYNLLTLLKPGIFKTQAEFRAAYMLPGKPRQPANVDNLRQLVRSAMIRNTRAVAALKLPRRTAITIKAEPAAGEAEAYAGVADAARALVAGSGTGGVGRQRLMLHHLLGAAGSSPVAASSAAARIADKLDGDKTWRAIADRFTAIPCGGKEAALINLLRRNADEKKLVFVQSRETLKHLAARLEAEGIGHARFDGSMSGPDKDAAVAVFREHSSVLLCTQTGGEGRNIQFCNTLINFDVPWNPMAIEQRIGRIDRIGQTREVFVFNLVARGTVEEKVLGLLEEKISMFELVVGEIGAIIGNVEEEREFPDLVLDAWLEASEAGRTAAFSALGNKLDVARRRYDEAKELDERLFGQDFETG